MSKYRFYILALVATLPALAMRLLGLHIAAPLEASIYGLAVLGAAFLLSWAAEAVQCDISAGAAIAALALITILPEYAVDLYYTWQAAGHPEYTAYAAANMTGANRLLVGFAWPLIVGLFWLRTGKKVVHLDRDNAVEVAFLALATLYSLTIPLKGELNLLDCAVLLVLFGGYMWRITRMPAAEEEIHGPALAIADLPKMQRRWAVGGLFVFAALLILLSAEPFAEALVHSGAALGIDEFLLIQWLAPLASEAPEVIVCILFTLSLKPTAALGALVSSKVNQWTLLVGMIPLVYALAHALTAGNLAALPLDGRQNEEFLLTAAQSLFAVALLLRLRLSIWSAGAIFALFSTQFALGFIFRDDEALVVQILTWYAYAYLALALIVIAASWRYLRDFVRIGLLGRNAGEMDEVMNEAIAEGREFEVE